MRDLAITLVFLAYLSVGALVPFAAALGYVWVDTFSPQQVSYGLLTGVPVSLMAALVTVGAYLLLDRRLPPRPGLYFGLALLMVIWMTITTFLWAALPDYAFSKWNWAVKTVAFSAFMPFLFRSRVQIEAFVLTWMFAAVIHIVPVGLKTMVGGGGYDMDLGVVSGNSLLSEGSTLSTVCAMFVPLLLWGRSHAQLVPERLRTPGFLGYAAVSGAAAIGTFARTALIAFAVVAIGLMLRSRRKVLTAVLLGIAVLGGALITGQRWDARMRTTETYGGDTSALTRLEVWKWTVHYAEENPLGGGFEVNRISRIETPDGNGGTFVQVGRAFHNAFMEILGEQGWVGLFIFLALCARSLVSLQRIRRLVRGIETFAWARDLAGALQIALVAVMAGSCFIGIAYQPIYWYLFALTECVRQHVRRAALGGVPAPTARIPPYGAYPGAVQPGSAGLGTAGSLSPAPLT